MMLTMTARRRFGAYSDISATEFESAPPRPRPVRNRQAISWSNVEQRDVSIANIPKMSVQQTIGHFRPQRSAIGPESMEEIIKPMRAKTKMGPKFLMGMCRDSAIEGARKPILWVSNPSRTMTMPHRVMVQIWYRPMG